MDIGKLLKAKQAWNSFGTNHPKFQAFLSAVYSRDIQEGMVIEVSVKYPDGSSMKSNLQVQKEDVALLEALKK